MTATAKPTKPVFAKNKKRGPEKSARRQAAEEARLSRTQMYRALAVSSIPQSLFEQMVESDNPPTVTELVEIARGTQSKPAQRRLSKCPHCGGDLTITKTTP